MATMSRVKTTIAAAQEIPPTPAIASAFVPDFPELWPTPVQELLLTAALGSGDEAHCAFQKWKIAKRYTEYEDVDYEASRLLPWVSWNFQQHGLSDSWLGKLKGLYRHTWARNVLQQRELARLLQALQQLHVPALILKGQALLAAGWIPQAGMRPMLDSDLFVSNRDVDKVVQTLSLNGWKRQVPAQWFPVRHAHCWQSPQGFELDLHVRLLPSPYPACLAEDLLPSAIPVNVAGEPTLVPGTTEMLLHLAVHGRLVCSKGPSPFLWAADTVHFLRSHSGEVDWGHLLELAQRFGVLLPLRDALGYLQARWHVPIPADWLTQAFQQPISRPHLRGFLRWAVPGGTLSAGELWQQCREDYRVAETTLGQRPSALRFCGFLGQCVLESLPKTRFLRIGRRVVTQAWCERGKVWKLSELRPHFTREIPRPD